MEEGERESGNRGVFRGAVICSRFWEAEREGRMGCGRGRRKVGRGLGSRGGRTESAQGLKRTRSRCKRSSLEAINTLPCSPAAGAGISYGRYYKRYDDSRPFKNHLRFFSGLIHFLINYIQFGNFYCRRNLSKFRYKTLELVLLMWRELRSHT